MDEKRSLAWLALGWIAPAFVAVGCATSHGPRQSTATSGVAGMVTRDAAMHIARAEFERHGRRASDYYVREVSQPDESEWRVWFEWKTGSVPGGANLVTVNKMTGAAQFLAGE